MNLPVNISADEFLKLIDQLDTGEAVKADEMFKSRLAHQKKVQNPCGLPGSLSHCPSIF
jgi:hypothetical protein